VGEEGRTSHIKPIFFNHRRLYRQVSTGTVLSRFRCLKKGLRWKAWPAAQADPPATKTKTMEVAPVLVATTASLSLLSSSSSAMLKQRRRRVAMA
jgi:hypothetical protein